MPATDVHRSRYRVAALTLAGTLFALVVFSFIQFGTTATDENIFTAPPSGSYVVRTGRPMRPDGDGLAVGDLVIAVAEQPTPTPDVVAAMLAADPSDRLPVRVFRPGAPTAREFVVDREALTSAEFRDVTHAAFIIDVTRGGASDRAGLRVGDIIVRINGQEFADIFEADAIMRRASVGRATAYQVLRGGQAHTFQVTLASFGFRLNLLFVVLVGLLHMALGLTLVLVRPGIKAARWLGFGFILSGFALAIFFIRRDIELSVFIIGRQVLMAVAMLAAPACFALGQFYFPRERTALVGARWRRVLISAVTLLSIGAALTVRTGVATMAGLAVVLAAAGLALFDPRRATAADEDHIRRQVWRFGYLPAVLGAVLLIVQTMRPFAWFNAAMMGALLLPLPLVVAHVIAKYRLLDLTIRVRKSLQYSLASVGWGLASALLLVLVLVWVAQFDVRFPALLVRESSLEFVDLRGGERSPAFERLAFMAVAVGLAFLLRHVGVTGQRYLAERFHRSAHDYRRASRELAEVTSSRLDLEGLADGLISTLANLLPLKRAGVMLTHDSRRYCGQSAHGLGREEWSAFCAEFGEDVMAGVARARAEVDAEYTFPRLRRALDHAQIKYLYPIRTHDQLVGALLVGEKRSEAPFEDADFEFIGAMATQVSASVENAFLYEDLARQERLRHELEIARRIQMASLPQFTPRVVGLDVAGVSMPAFEVGGDYFDYLDGSPSRFTVMVGDVSGKGTSAALYMSKLQGIVRSLHGFGLGPRELFVRTNDLIGHDLDRRAFVTALGAFFDLERHRLVLARAGHLPLLRLNAGTGEIDRFLPRGLGLGLTMGEAFDRELEELEIGYAPGDVFLFITDGITECQSPAREEFGEERVIEFLSCLAVPHDAR
ncbi:MAG: SpoIIE family protein phosphatase, partial [Vicinamibacteraceae bacterium]|nr:SpoIIE family protein phosphatase [Vicinamibacteraceae bacterium]